MNVVSPIKEQADEAEVKLRPQMLSDFTGQKDTCENLQVFINAAKKREEPLDHTLLYGPPGLGKTTISHIIANEMGVGFRATSGPILTRAADLAAILTNLQENEVLFIDEIHRLNSTVEEVLYPAMEDFKLDLIIGEGPAARTVRIDLPKFTLVGATTRLGLLTNPLRDRFGIPLKLDFYSYEELEKMIIRGAGIMNAEISKDGAAEIARRARGTPRIALRLLRRIRDFAEADNAAIDKKLADSALARLDVDKIGLDGQDRKYLRYIASHYDGGPVGIETIAAGLSEERDTLEETIEPYLLQQGFIQRTPRGRMLTQSAFAHLGLKMPENLTKENPDLF
ncbi:MAG: Holliday junction branch migration DNA helicase RuvB [Alphaproteobacteria bacterium CG11_big_fil_rev_8_21_14_0_20_44_7]|nr:MAG: Holliday junction branch migration DNA helicase RuvB [Alphaproteobacteria bacterium CG11_big_fil_rev_8_21_14_0_20_44_7]